MNRRDYTGPHWIGIPASPIKACKTRSTTNKTTPKTRFFRLFSRLYSLVLSLFVMAEVV